jgi:CubicO group peptidase (beta-lactamase class C family)
MTPTLRAFAAVPSHEAMGRRPIGFDHATPGASTGGALPPTTVGHLGFTGVSLWADRDNARAYALLTNRIHETREGGAEKILGLRRRFHTAAAAT